MSFLDNMMRERTAVRFGELTTQTLGKDLAFEISVFLEGLDPESVRVELYADGGENEAARHEMKRVRPLASAPGAYVYATTVPAGRPPSDYTARVVPNRGGVAVPLEEPRVLWQR